MFTVNIMLCMAGVLFGCYTHVMLLFGVSSFRMFGRISATRRITVVHIASLYIPTLDATLNEWAHIFLLSII